MKRCGVVILIVLSGMAISFAQDSLNVTMVGSLDSYWDLPMVWRYRGTMLMWRIICGTSGSG